MTLSGSGIAVFNSGNLEQVGTPYDLDTSKTEFVCNFIGDINRLDPGLIENSPLKGHVPREKVAYIRNEKVSLSPMDGQDVVRLPATVVDREVLSYYSKYVLEVSGGSLIKTIEKESGHAGIRSWHAYRCIHQTVGYYAI